jgi:hypothetical protein
MVARFFENVKAGDLRKVLYTHVHLQYLNLQVGCVQRGCVRGGGNLKALETLGAKQLLPGLPSVGEVSSDVIHSLVLSRIDAKLGSAKE